MTTATIVNDPQTAFDLGARLSRTPAPASIVIFGASGDLSHRKLMPALYNLALQQLLPPEMNIIGMSRSPWSDEEFRAEVRDAVATHCSHSAALDEAVWEAVRRAAGLPEALRVHRPRGLCRAPPADSRS